jgi:hypothetical protein
MSNITVTLFVKPESLFIFMVVIMMIDKLPFDNEYVFTPSDLKFSETFDSASVQVNLDAVLFTKFRNRFEQLKK